MSTPTSAGAAPAASSRMRISLPSPQPRSSPLPAGKPYSTTIASSTARHQLVAGWKGLSRIRRRSRASRIIAACAWRTSSPKRRRKAARSKRMRVLAAGLRREARRVALEAAERGPSTAPRSARRTARRSAGASSRARSRPRRRGRGDHRRAAGLRLDHADAEILLAGEDEGARALHERDELGVRQAAAQLDVRRVAGARRRAASRGRRR